MSSVLRKHLRADKSHTIHIVLAPEMGVDVDVIISPSSPNKVQSQQESLEMAKIMDESGFAKNILNSAEEDCWNDL